MPLLIVSTTPPRRSSSSRTEWRSGQSITGQWPADEMAIGTPCGQTFVVHSSAVAAKRGEPGGPSSMRRLITASNAFYLQLELRGLTRLGPNPLDVLKRSITGYAKSDEFDPPQ